MAEKESKRLSRFREEKKGGGDRMEKVLSVHNTSLDERLYHVQPDYRSWRWAEVRVQPNRYGTAVRINIRLFHKKEFKIKKLFLVGTAVDSGKFQPLSEIETFLSKEEEYGGDKMFGQDLKWALLHLIAAEVARIGTGAYTFYKKS